MKKAALTILTILLLTAYSFAQVAINETGDSPDPSAILDISSTNKGLLIPRVTTIQRNAIGTTQSGLLVYDTDKESFWYYDNTLTDWVELVVDGHMDLDGISDAKTDTRSVFLGNFSGDNDDGSNYNTATGIFSAQYNTSGINNAFFGYSAGQNNTSGKQNTFIGESAGRSNSEGEKNTIVGAKANYTSQSGNYNTIIGYEAGRGTTSHSKSGNIFIGFQAGYHETGENKLYIDNNATSTPLIEGDFSTNEIYFNGQIKITGGSPGVDKILTSDANGFARWADNAAAAEINGLSDGISDLSNLFLGNYTGAQDDGDNQNTGVGINTLYWNVGGIHNTALGYKSSFRNTSGSSNTSFGNNALYFNTVKSDLVAVGDSALYNNGNNASGSNQEGNSNTAVGSKSLLYNGSGYGNTALGSHSMYENGSGFLNVALGYNSLQNNTDGDYNLSVGAYSSGVNTTGSENVSLGYGSDYFNDGGSQNVIIGTHAGRGSSGQSKSGNIFVGYKAGYSETGSNKLYIDNSNTTSPLIFGDFESDILSPFGSVGINTKTPLGELHVHSTNKSHNTIYITPKTTGSADSASIFFAEDHDATYGMYWMYDGSGNELELWGKSSSIHNGPHLVVKRDNGNVAIGNSFASGYKLSVDGKVICEELRVNLQADWPDYVFKNGYKLMPVKQLESFIEDNGHLPNIPSSKEMHKTGLEIGEMQRLMMEKIEELTLYIIEQQKQIDDLKNNQ